MKKSYQEFINGLFEGQGGTFNGGISETRLEIVINAIWNGKLEAK